LRNPVAPSSILNNQKNCQTRVQPGSPRTLSALAALDRCLPQLEPCRGVPPANGISYGEQTGTAQSVLPSPSKVVSPAGISRPLKIKIGVSPVCPKPVTALNGFDDIGRLRTLMQDIQSILTTLSAGESEVSYFEPLRAARIIASGHHIGIPPAALPAATPTFSLSTISGGASPVTPATPATPFRPPPMSIVDERFTGRGREYRVMFRDLWIRETKLPRAKKPYAAGKSPTSRITIR
ncbi:hypothetical protein H2203_005273, partial [Taxawa tesnikishii (nom. ined.)]